MSICLLASDSAKKLVASRPVFTDATSLSRQALRGSMPDLEDKSKTELWKDERVWLELFQPLFARDGDLADRAAKLFDYLSLEIDSGPKGVTHVGICLENALRLIFPYTSVGRTCMILFQVSLGKDFPTQPDTLDTLTEAMKRTRTALDAASKSKSRPRPAL